MLQENTFRRRHNRRSKNEAISICNYEHINFANSLKSIKIEKQYFTNYFTSDKCKEFNLFLNLYESHLIGENILKKFISDDINPNDNFERIYQIINSFNNSVTKMDIINILKFKYEEFPSIQLFIKQDGKDLNVYLIDVYHLGIPAEHPVLHKKDPKGIYNAKKNAKYCLSSIPTYSVLQALEKQEQEQR